MAKYSPKTMQNGKIVNITDKMITLELKYDFYCSKECREFILDERGYLCLYNFETGQIFSIPATLKTVGENENDTMQAYFQLSINSNTSVYINISTDKLSNIDADLLSNPEVFGFCLIQNTDSLILSELQKLLTFQLQSCYESKPDNILIFFISIYASIVFSLFILTRDIQFPIYGIFFLFIILVGIKLLNESSVEEQINGIIKYCQINKRLPLFKRRLFTKKMKIILERILQVREHNNQPNKLRKSQPKRILLKNKQPVLSLNEISNLLLISDKDLKQVCNNTYILYQTVISVPELANRKHLKSYIDDKLKRIEKVLNIWKTANNISQISQAEADNIKQKSIDTINLINKKLKEKIQNEILLININLSSELEALKIVENLR